MYTQRNMDDASLVAALRTEALGKTSGNTLGGYDYFYIGSYEGGTTNDLDKLITEMLRDEISVSGGCDECGGGCSTCGGCECKLFRESCDDCGGDGGAEGGLVATSGGAKSKKNQLKEEDILEDTFSKDKDEPIVREDSDESLVVPSSNIATYEQSEVSFKQDPDRDNTLVVAEEEAPLIIDTTPAYGDSAVIKAERNTPRTKAVPREVADVFEDDTLIITTGKVPGEINHEDKKPKKTTKENTRADNVKVEYKRVREFVEKYANTIKNTNR